MTAGLVDPIWEYSHSSGCSITGGEMYRGSAYPGLYGTYLFGDFCTGIIWGLKHDGTQWVTTQLTTFNNSLTTFGKAEDGSMYAAFTSSGIFLVSDGDPLLELFRINAGLNEINEKKRLKNFQAVMEIIVKEDAIGIPLFTIDNL